MYGIISGILFIASLPPFNIYEAGLFAFVPLFIYLIRNAYYPAVMQSLYFGLIIGAYSFFGIFSYEMIPYIATVLLIIAVFMLFISASWFLARPHPLIGALTIPGIWILMERVLALANIPAPISILVTDSPTLLIPAGFGGQYLISILLIGSQYLLALLYIRSTYQRRNQVFIVFSLLGLFLLLRLYEYSIDKPDTRLADSAQSFLRLALVQTNLHPLNTLNIAADHSLEEIRNNIETYTRELRMLKTRPQLVVWPELSAERFEFRNPRHTGAQAAMLGIPMLVPSPDLNPDGSTVNALFAVSGNGKVLKRQVKARLIPYFETDSGHTPSPTPLLGIPGNPAALICFESAFSDSAVEMTRAGAGFIFIATNDAYAGPSFLSLLHEALARLRAVESARTVVRAANGGPSSVIGRDGRFQLRSGMYRDGILQANIALYRDQTLYVRFQPWILNLYWVYGGISLIIVLLLAAKRLKLQSLPSMRMQPASLLVSVLAASSCVLYQYSSATQAYTKITGKQLPPGFVHFQHGMFHHEPVYTSLRSTSPNGALLASLTYLLRDYGIDTSLATIRMLSEDLSSSRNPNALLTNIVTRYGYRFHSHAVDSNTGNEVYTPALTQLKTGETVVLKDFNNASVTFFSPFLGKIFTVKSDAFRKKWLGNLLILLPEPKPWDQA